MHIYNERSRLGLTRISDSVHQASFGEYSPHLEWEWKRLVSTAVLHKLSSRVCMGWSSFSCANCNYWPFCYNASKRLSLWKAFYQLSQIWKIKGFGFLTITKTLRTTVHALFSTNGTSSSNINNLFEIFISINQKCDDLKSSVPIQQKKSDKHIFHSW